uniref:Ig-like domain-containing protein n=1 Tax=Anas platyrhynchos TaxID=8839 RepID=A0A8B9R0A0_ANAPL
MGLPWGCGRPSLTGHASGFLTSLVTLHLLQLGSGRILQGCWGLCPLCMQMCCHRAGEPQLRVVGPGHPVTATMGQDVVLPCHLSPQRDAHTLEIRWIRDHISETVHHYRNGQDLYREQMEAYAGRTELARDGLSAGRLDLRITGLRPSDDGLYFCTVEDADAYDEVIVDLELSPGLCVPPRTRSHPHGHLRGKLAEQGWSGGRCSAGIPLGLEQGALGGRPGSMAAAWGWWQGAAPLHMFPPSNQAALLTTSSSAFAFQRHRAESWESPCSPCPQPLGKWCLCGRAWSGWALGACVLVAQGCWRSSWSLGWEWGVLGLGLPWARDTAGMPERNGDQGGDGE